MKHLKMIYALANREVIERRSIFALALVFGLISVFGPYVFGLSSQGSLKSDWRELSAVVALMLGIFSCLGVAFFTGVVLFGSDLSEKRMGFYFSRPIPALALWTGKILAGWTLMAGSFFIPLVPSFLVGANPLKGLFEIVTYDGWMYPVLPLVLFGVGLVASIAFRSRSRWLIFDLVAIPIILLLAMVGLVKLYRYEAMSLIVNAMLGFGAIASVGMLIASALSTVQGRTNLIQTHRVISLVLCTVLLFGAGSVQIYAHWALSVTPTDLESVYLGKTVHPNWVLLISEVAHRKRFAPPFLYNISTGHMTLIQTYQGIIPEIACSPDGQHCAWINTLQPLPGFADEAIPTGTLMVMDTSRNPFSQPVPTELTFPGSTELVFSADGQWLVATNQERVELLNFQTRRITTQLTFPVELQKEGYITVNEAGFVSPEVLRLYRIHPKKSGRQIIEFNLTTGDIRQTGFLKVNPIPYITPGIGPVHQVPRYFRFFNNFERAFISSPVVSTTETGAANPLQSDGSPRFYETQVFDARTGDHLFSMPSLDNQVYSFSVIGLSDHRMVRLVHRKHSVPASLQIQPAYLEVFSASGVLERTIAVEKAGEFQGVTEYNLSGESSAGKVLVLSETESYQQRQMTRFSVIDCNTGEIQEKLRSQSLFQGMMSWSQHGAAKENETRLFLERPGRGKPRSLIYFNPETGEKRTLVGAKN